MAKRGKVIFRSRRTEALRQTEQAWMRATREVAAEMQLAIKASLAAPYPPASKPGRLPHKRSGLLQAGVRVEGGKALTIRSLARHGIFLEMGTIYMAARTWASRQFQGALGRKWAKNLADKVRQYTRKPRAKRA